MVKKSCLVLTIDHLKKLGWQWLSNEVNAVDARNAFATCAALIRIAFSINALQPALL